MRHIKNYSKLVRMCRAYFAKDRKETEEHLALIERTLADPKNKDPRGDYYRYPKGTQFAGNYCDPEHAKRLKGYLKGLPSNEKAWLDRVERADKGGKVVEIHVSIDWKRSRTWGHNPTAEVWFRYDGGERGDGGNAYAKSASIGGCGYDRRSTAVSEALSKLDDDAKAALDRLVFEGGERVWKEYVFERSPVPHLSFGGKGISTFTGLFPYIGCDAKSRKRYAFPQFVIECDERSSVHDSYHVYLRRKI